MGSQHSAIIPLQNCISRCSSGEQTTINNIFQDIAQNGFLSQEKFITSFLGLVSPNYILHSWKYRISVKMFEIFDLNSDQFLDQDEFFCAYTFFLHSTDEEKRKFSFMLFSSSSYLSFENLLKSIKDLPNIQVEDIVNIQNTMVSMSIGYADNISLATYDNICTIHPFLYIWLHNLKPQKFGIGNNYSVVYWLNTPPSLHRFNSLTENEIERIIHFIVTKNTFQISFTSLRSLFQPFLPAIIIDPLINVFDHNSDEILSLHEYLHSISIYSRGSTDQKLSFLFESFDHDHDNMVTSSEYQAFQTLVELFYQMPLAPYPQLSLDSSLSLDITKQIEKFFSTHSTMNYQDFRSYTLNDPRVVKCLQYLRFLMLTICGVLPQTPEEQRDIIRRCWPNDIHSDSVYCLLDVNWWSKWVEFVHWNQGADTKITHPCPSSIDNSKLVDDNMLLLPDKMHEKDYISVSLMVYTSLAHWYGGGPKLARRVISSSGTTENKTQILEYHPLILNYRVISASSTSNYTNSIIVSRGDKIQKCISMMSNQLGIAYKYCRLWNQYDQEKHLCDQNDNASSLEHNNNLYLEIASCDGWILKANPLPPLNSGLVGIKNLGNTCFLSVVLQAFSHTIPLQQYFMDDYHLCDMPDLSSLNSHIVIEIAFVFKQLWQTKSFSSISVNQLKWAMGRFHQSFSGYYQQDAHEALQLLMDSIHEALKPKLCQSEINEEKESTESEKKQKIDNITYLTTQYLSSFQKQNHSFMTHMFYLHVKSTLTCPDCNYQSHTFEPYSNLPLSIPQLHGISKEIRLYWYNTSKKPSYYHLTLSHNSRISHLRQSLSKISSIPYEDIIIASYHQNFITHSFDFSEKDENVLIYTLPSSLFVFELKSSDCPKPAQINASSNSTSHPIKDDKITPHIDRPLSTHIDYWHFTFLHRTFDSPRSSIFHLSPMLFLPPFILLLPSNMSIFSNLFSNFIELSTLYDIIWKQVIYLCPNYNKKFTKTNFNSFSPAPFKLCAVNKNGTSCYLEHHWLKGCFGCYLNTMAVDDIISFDQVFTISIDWHQDFLKNNVDLSIPHDVFLHNSIKEKQFSSHILNFNECLTSFSGIERVDFKCSKCKENKSFSKQLSLCRCPPLLIIQLKRFAPDGSKINTFIDFPLDLDISPILDPEIEKHSYTLYTVINHISTNNGYGHYICYIYNHLLSQWYCYDDENVNEIDKSLVKTKSAYILFYKRSDIDFTQDFLTTYGTNMKNFEKYSSWINSEEHELKLAEIQKRPNSNASDCIII